MSHLRWVLTAELSSNQEWLSFSMHFILCSEYLDNLHATHSLLMDTYTEFWMLWQGALSLRLRVVIVLRTRSKTFTIHEHWKWVHQPIVTVFQTNLLNSLLVYNGLSLTLWNHDTAIMGWACIRSQGSRVTEFKGLTVKSISLHVVLN